MKPLFAECPDKVPADIEPKDTATDTVFSRQCQAWMVFIDPDDIDDKTEEIRIIGNPISAILNYTFAQKRDCRILSLAYNEIHTLDIHAFTDMLSLEELYLNGNMLTEIRRGVFDEISLVTSTLTHIYLQDNFLTTLSASIFTKVTSLQFLDLRNNPLGSIEYELLLQLSSITVIGISEGMGLFIHFYNLL